MRVMRGSLNPDEDDNDEMDTTDGRVALGQLKTVGKKRQVPNVRTGANSKAFVIPPNFYNFSGMGDSSYFMHKWRLEKEDTYRFWGQKVIVVWLWFNVTFSDISAI